MQHGRTAIVAIALGVSFLCAGADRYGESSGALGQTATGSPLERALEMLQGLKGSITKDAEQEDRDFQAFTKWCSAHSRDVKSEIKVEKIDVEDLTATIDKSTSDASISKSKIEDIATSQSETEGELKAAEAVREKEHHQFAATEAELLDSIDTLERASNVLQRKMRGTALVETAVNRNDIKDLVRTLNEVVNAAALSLHDEKKLISLAQSSEDDDDDDDLGEFGNDGGKGHGSILDMLEDLKQKAEKQLTELRNEETNALHNFQMVKASLTDEINLASKEISQAKEAAAAAAQAKAVAAGDLSVTDKALVTDKDSLEDLKHLCIDRAAEYEASVKSRKEELHSVNSALEVLSETMGGKASSFLELQSATDRFDVVNLLRKLSESQQNTALAQLANRVSTVLSNAVRNQDADPFSQVKSMISGMVERLEKEGKDEAGHKEYCDKEKKQTQEKKDDLGDSIDKQTADLDKAKAKSTALGNQITGLQQDLAEMAKQQTEADQMRRDERDNYESTKSDLQKGMQGIRRALDVLQKHFGQSVEDVKGTKGGINGVLALLGVVEEDITKKLANIEEEEKSSASTYDKLTKDNKVSKRVKEQDLKYKTKESKSLGKDLAEHSSDLDALSTEMDAVNDYASNIRSTCDLKPETYADRQARRQDEIDGLQEALGVLQQQASMLQTDATPQRSSLRGAAVSRH